MKNITYIISNINKSIAFEWIALHLNDKKFNINFILLNKGNTDLEDFLKQNKFLFTRIKYTGKKDILKAIFYTCKFLIKNKSDVVHTHLFEANFVGLIAAKICRIPKIIHTRHHSNYHHTYYPKAVKYDILANKLSTEIVAISAVVKDILIKKEKVNPNKINLIHHGFDIEQFNTVSKTRIENAKKRYIHFDNKPIIGVISRYTELKGIQYIITGFEKLLKEYPNALIILANCNGSYKKEIKKLLEKIPKKNYIEIEFENDIFSLYKLFDVFVHVPISSSSEAFGQTYVEALAAGIPSVFTLSGVANEFIKDRENAIVVPFCDSDSIYTAIKELLSNEKLRSKLISQGKEDVYKLFYLNKMIGLLENLYEK